jgi:DEAD/DEAH box helicase domain-containing protein
LTLDPAAAGRIGLYEGGRSGAFFGFGRLLHRVTPLYIRCDASDLGVKAEILSAHFGQPTVILFDEIPGGVGLSEAALRHHRTILKAMRALLKRCACTNGCPCCVDPALEGEREHKTTALAVVDLLLGNLGLWRNSDIQDSGRAATEKPCSEEDGRFMEKGE